MMTRRFWMLIHRYVGLAMALLLIIVGLTGSVLAFYQELDRWFNPELLTVPVRDAPIFDPFTLGERAETLEPHAWVSYLKLNGQPGEAYGVWMEPKIDPATGEAYPLSHDELFLDPYTGETLGTRKWGEVSLAKENLLPFLYRLHYSLALPEVTGSLGGYPGYHGAHLDARLFHRLLSDLAVGAKKTPSQPPPSQGGGKSIQVSPLRRGRFRGGPATLVVAALEARLAH